MSKRPFWNPRDMVLLAAALLALGALPAFTRLAPMSWASVLNAPQWWSNLRMLGESTCMTPLYARGASIREHMFEPSCSFGWGADGRADYRITRIRYRFEEAASIELEAKKEVRLEPEALAVFGLPVRSEDRRTLAYTEEGTVRTLRWWGVKHGALELDLVELIEVTSRLGGVKVALRLHVDRYVYDTAHLRDTSDEPELGLALPAGMTMDVRDRPHVWLSSREVGVREPDDETGPLNGWRRAELGAPELDTWLGAYMKRQAASQHGDAHLLSYVSRGVTMERLGVLLERARALKFKRFSLFALRETVRGRTRQGRSPDDYTSSAQPMLSLSLDEGRQDLTLEVTPSGFTLARRTPSGLMRIAPLDGCPVTGVTVCLEPGGSSPRDAFERAARADESGEIEEGTEAFEAGMARFDFHRLHVLLELEMGRPSRPRGLMVRASPDVPVGLLTRALTAARIRRGPESPPGSGEATSCVLPPDEDTMWSWAPCLRHRELSVHFTVSPGQGL